jgi:hypothetical protein
LEALGAIAELMDAAMARFDVPVATSPAVRSPALRKKVLLFVIVDINLDDKVHKYMILVPGK